MLSDNNIKHENTFRLRTNLNDSQMKIRIPSCVKEHIDQEAKKNGRSIILSLIIASQFKDLSKYFISLAIRDDNSNMRALSPQGKVYFLGSGEWK